MFAINSFADVLSVAKTFGVASLDFIKENYTMNREANQWIIDCRKWAVSNTVEIASFNDGNTEWSLEARFTVTNVGNEYVTNEIVFQQHGVGSFLLSTADAVKEGRITKEQLQAVLSTIKARNEARAILGL